MHYVSDSLKCCLGQMEKGQMCYSVNMTRFTIMFLFIRNIVVLFCFLISNVTLQSPIFCVSLHVIEAKSKCGKSRPFWCISHSLFECWQLCHVRVQPIAEKFFFSVFVRFLGEQHLCEEASAELNSTGGHKQHNHIRC